jgi:hypothetical protein
VFRANARAGKACTGCGCQADGTDFAVFSCGGRAPDRCPIEGSGRETIQEKETGMVTGGLPSHGKSQSLPRVHRSADAHSGAQWFRIGENWSLVPIRRFPRFFLLFGCLAALSILSTATTLHLADRYVTDRWRNSELETGW